MTTYLFLEGCVDNHWCYIGTNIPMQFAGRQDLRGVVDRLVQVIHPIGQYANLSEITADQRKDLLDHGMVRHEGIARNIGVKAICGIVGQSLMQMFGRPEEILGLYDELRLVAVVSK